MISQNIRLEHGPFLSPERCENIIKVTNCLMKFFEITLKQEEIDGKIIPIYSFYQMYCFILKVNSIRCHAVGKPMVCPNEVIRKCLIMELLKVRTGFRNTNEERSGAPISKGATA